MDYQSPPSSGAPPLRFQTSDSARHQSDANASMTQIVHHGFPHNCNTPSCSQSQRNGPPSHISPGFDQQVSFSRFSSMEFTSLTQRFQSSQARILQPVCDANCNSMSLADRRLSANIIDQPHAAVNQRNAAAMQQPDQANTQHLPRHRNGYQQLQNPSAVSVRRLSCLVLYNS